MKNVAIIGDIHTRIDSLVTLLETTKVDLGISVGDLALYTTETEAIKDAKAWIKNGPLMSKYAEQLQNGTFKKLPVPLKVVKGNHDDYKSMFSEILIEKNILFLEQAAHFEIEGVTFGVLGGIRSPKAIERDATKFKERERRFFTRVEVEKLKDVGHVDVLITHAMASELDPKKEYFKSDEGYPEFKDLLDTLSPQYYFHGHHHKNYETMYKHTKVYGLGNMQWNTSSYKVLQLNNGGINVL